MHSFHYYEEAPQSWEASLRQIKSLGETQVRIPCYWGIHETTKGMRDFARSPKLRLEKLFTLIRNEGLKAQLDLGFFPSAHSFPQWTYAEKTQGLTPAVFWNEHEKGFRFRRIPSFTFDSFQDSFCEFLEEALNLAALYVDSPLSKISVQLGIIRSDLTLASTPSYLDLFQKKYTKLETLNKKFLATYRSVPINHSEQLYKALFEKRPWLAAYDYQCFRQALLNSFAAKISNLNGVQNLKELISLEENTSFEDVPNKPTLLIDGVFLEKRSEKLAPFFPELCSNAMSTFAFRLGEYFKAQSEKSNYNFMLASGEKHASSSPFIVVVAGKFLSKNTVGFLERAASEGTRVFFPFGFPLYNEELEEISWSRVGSREVVKGKNPYIKVRLHKGCLTSSVGALPITEDLWANIEAYSMAIKEN